MQVVKSIAAGMLFGALAFAMPFFLLKVAGFIFIAGLLFRLFARRRFGPGWQGKRMEMMDKIRTMSQEEYETFKASFSKGCGYRTQSQTVN